MRVLLVLVVAVGCGGTQDTGMADVPDFATADQSLVTVKHHDFGDFATTDIELLEERDPYRSVSLVATSALAAPDTKGYLVTLYDFRDDNGHRWSCDDVEFTCDGLRDSYEAKRSDKIGRPAMRTMSVMLPKAQVRRIGKAGRASVTVCGESFRLAPRAREAFLALWEFRNVQH